jgi:hypothetical protein
MMEFVRPKLWKKKLKRRNRHEQGKRIPQKTSLKDVLGSVVHGSYHLNG